MATTFTRIMPSGSATGAPIVIDGDDAASANEIHVVGTTSPSSTEVRLAIHNGSGVNATITVLFDQATDKTQTKLVPDGETWVPEPYSLTGTVTVKVFTDTTAAATGGVTVAPRITTLTVS